MPRPRFNIYGGGGGGGGLTPDQERLRQYDSAVSAEQRPQIEAEKMDFKNQQLAFAKAEAERKAENANQRADFTERRLQISDEAAKLREQVAQNTELLKQQQQLVKDKATVARQQAGMEFYKGIADLNPQSPNFRKDYSTLMSNVQSKLVDSDGKLPEDVMKVSDHLFAQHNTWAATAAKPQVDPVHQFQDALAASQPIYGIADAKKPSVDNFTATEAGTKDVNGKGLTGADQTHVQTTFIPPGKKDAVTQVFPRSVFDAAVAASQARQQTPQQINVNPNAASSQNTPSVSVGGITIGGPSSTPTQATAPVSGGTLQPDGSMQPVAPVVAAPAASVQAAPSEYTDPAMVRNDYQAGRLNRDQAIGILQNQFGHQ